MRPYYPRMNIRYPLSTPPPLMSLRPPIPRFMLRPTTVEPVAQAPLPGIEEVPVGDLIQLKDDPIPPVVPSPRMILNPEATFTLKPTPSIRSKDYLRFWPRCQSPRLRTEKLKLLMCQFLIKYQKYLQISST